MRRGGGEKGGGEKRGGENSGWEDAEPSSLENGPSSSRLDPPPRRDPPENSTESGSVHQGEAAGVLKDEV